MCVLQLMHLAINVRHVCVVKLQIWAVGYHYVCNPMLDWYNACIRVNHCRPDELNSKGTPNATQFGIMICTLVWSFWLCLIANNKSRGKCEGEGYQHLSTKHQYYKYYYYNGVTLVHKQDELHPIYFQSMDYPNAQELIEHVLII